MPDLPTRLNAKRQSNRSVYDPRVLTVRLSPELHDRLKVLSHAERLSMNQLAVVALEHACEELGREGEQTC